MCGKTSYHFINDIILPLMFYFNDFESNNPKSGKLGVIYITLLCLPSECQFNSDNIFLTLIFESINRKIYGNKKTFAPLIDEFNHLASEGIFITTQ